MTCFMNPWTHFSSIKTNFEIKTSFLAVDLDRFFLFMFWFIFPDNAGIGAYIAYFFSHLSIPDYKWVSK